MVRVLVQDDLICSATVGLFAPTVLPGTPLQPGLPFGRLQQLGRWHELHVPAGLEGLAEPQAERPIPVEYGTPLLRVRARASRKRDKVKAAVKSIITGGRTVRAELEGTLYLRPGPEAPPFAAEGTRVSAQDTIAVVEVMKAFHRVRAPCAGLLRRWLIQDGASVHPGTPLALIELETSQLLPERR